MIEVVLVKPTQYGDDGYPQTYWRAVQPSRALMTVFQATKEALERLKSPTQLVKLHLLDECIAAHLKRHEELLNRRRAPGTKLIVCLVGVQSSQMPRAEDLVERWQRRGAVCVIGGAHVTSAITIMLDGLTDERRDKVPCPHRMPEELQALADRGVVIFHGEAESGAGSSVWEQALGDILNGRQKNLYRGGRPDLTDLPIAQCPKEYLDCFVSSVEPVDNEHGCPFKCDFCCAIQVHGREPRSRGVERIVAYLKSVCQERGRAQIFFTGDNFVRSSVLDELLDALKDLKERGYKISFMIQADLACDKIPRFIERMSEAGGTQIFFGVESLKKENLLIAGKLHNHPDRYRALFDRCHQANITVNAAYILGFAYDTPASMAADVEQLFELGADVASFFILGPIPGSVDWIRLKEQGRAMDSDLNHCDSFHVVMDHPKMTREEWFGAYREAWRQFYSPAHMAAAIKRFVRRDDRWRLLANYLWYWWSVRVEQTHPMIAGFYRVRRLRDRRPGMEKVSALRFAGEEIWRHCRYLGYLLAVFYVFQQVVFEAEFAPKIAGRREQLARPVRGFRDWWRRTFGREVTRAWLNNFWITYGRRKWQLLNPLKWTWHLKMIPHAITEVVYTVRYSAYFVKLLAKLAT